MADTNTYLVHERNLDDNLRAKVNGIGTGSSGDMFKDYVKTEDLTERLTQLQQDFQNALKANKNEAESLYYKKTDTISKDSLTVAYNDINGHETRIATLEKNLNTLSNGLDERIQSKIDAAGTGGSSSSSTDVKILQTTVSQNTQNISSNRNLINQNTTNISDLSSKLSSLTTTVQNLQTNLTQNYRNKSTLITYNDLSSDLQSRISNSSSGDTSSLQDAVNQNTLNIGVNKNNITKNANEITTLKNAQSTFRKKTDLITSSDLSNDLLKTINTYSTAASDLQNSKQDKIYGEAGCILYMGDNQSVSALDFVVRGYFVTSNTNAQAAMTSYYPDIYDIYNNRLYTYKDGYTAWNDDSSFDSTSYQDNTTVEDTYSRVNFDTNYKADPADAITIVDEHITFSKACTFTFGFYGTKVKLTGTLLSYQESITNPKISLTIDGVEDAASFTYVATDAAYADTENVCLFSAENLSIGRHTISLQIPDSCGLTLNTYIDIDEDNAAILKSGDILDDFTAYHFNNQDNWETVPSEYTIEKSSDLFTLDNVATNDVYTSQAVTNLTTYENKLLYSCIDGSMYIISNDVIYRINGNATTSETKIYNKTIAPQKSSTITEANIMSKNVIVYIENIDETYTKAPEDLYSLVYTENTVTIKNISNVEITYRIYI